jgi:predicted nuclease of predicted toxin-antitoxin system
LWNHPDFLHLKNLDDSWPDEQVWEYARQHNLTIITKDSDFSPRILLRQPPPKVIHLRFGNLRMNEFHQYLTSVWPQLSQLSNEYKLVNVFHGRLEGVK